MLTGTMARKSRPSTRSPRAPQEAAHGARDGRQHDVVERAAEAVLDLLYRLEVEPRPVEAAVRAEVRIEHGARGGNAAGREVLDDAGERVARQPENALRLTGQA